jgi:chemosensory pili system protein ChpA (sensor histidine kinase/response regulator)
MNQKNRVLLIDGDDLLREALHELLPDAGYEVASAKNGLDGLDALRTGSRRPDVVLLDFSPPVLDAMRFLVARAKDKVLSRVPVILLLGPSSHTFVRDPRVRDLADIVRKPLRVHELLGALTRCCGAGAATWERAAAKTPS